MTFDDIKAAVPALTDAQKAELLALLMGGGAQPQSGDNGPKPPIPPKQP